MTVIPVNKAANTAHTTEVALAQVAEALGRLRFGDIRLTVHEGRLVQIDVTEKMRFSSGSN